MIQTKLSNKTYKRIVFGLNYEWENLSRPPSTCVNHSKIVPLSAFNNILSCAININSSDRLETLLIMVQRNSYQVQLHFAHGDFLFLIDQTILYIDMMYQECIGFSRMNEKQNTFETPMIIILGYFVVYNLITLTILYHHNRN